MQMLMRLLLDADVDRVTTGVGLRLGTSQNNNLQYNAYLGTSKI
jgi:hypothetical protein